MIRHHERGQVLPVWAMGVVAMVILTLAVLRYSDMVRWQIRAQNAADSAAQAIVALQTQQYNEMTSVLYASAVEEYRIRQTLYALELTAYGNGGCEVDGSCVSRYASLYQNYEKATARYRTEVILLDRITANLEASTLQNDASALLAQMSATCGNVGGLDCGTSTGKFGYALVTPFSGRNADGEPLYTVEMDARAFIKPSLGDHQTPVGALNEAFDPGQVEVAVCADVPSPVPPILNFQPAPHRVIARSAATAVMMEQDWFQPGSLYNPWTQTFYQPEEYPSGGASNDGTGTDWYAVDFGGNASTADTTNNGYTFGIYSDEFSAYLGWWNAVPIRPQSGNQPDASLGCSS